MPVTVGTMKSSDLSFNTRKALCNHLTENAGKELADLIQQLVARIEHLEHNKVDITRIIPEQRSKAG